MMMMMMMMQHYRYSLFAIIRIHILALFISNTAGSLSDEIKRTCKVLAEHELPENCPINNRTSDWLCQAESFNCSGEEQFHCAQLAGTEPGNVLFIRACAKPVTCAPGEEPYLKQKKNKFEVQCGPCWNKNAYNPKTMLSSWYAQCPQEKLNQCIEKRKKKDCGLERGGLSWKQTTQSDGLCRCDSRAGYRPVDFDENPTKYLSDRCFSEYMSCVHFICEPGMELSLDYLCTKKCPEGFIRSDVSDECRNLSDPTETPLSSITKLETELPTSTDPPLLQATPQVQNGSVTKSMDGKQDIIVPITISLSVLAIVIVAVALVVWCAHKQHKQYNANRREKPLDGECPEVKQFLSDQEQKSETSSSGLSNVKEYCCRRSPTINISNNSFTIETVVYPYKGTTNITLAHEITDGATDPKMDSLPPGLKNGLHHGLIAMKTQSHSARFKVNDDVSDIESAASMDNTCDIELGNANTIDEKFEDIQAHSSDKLDIALMLLSRLAQLLSTAFQEAGPTPWSWLAKVDPDAIHSSLESFANDLGVCLEDLINFPQPPSLLRFCVPVKEARGVPVGYEAYQTSGSSNCCLYQAISIHLCGNEKLQHQLRLCSALYTLENMSLYIQEFEDYLSQRGDGEAIAARLQQVFSCYGVELDEHQRKSSPSWRDQLPVMMFKVVMETCEANKDSSQLHVDLLSNAIGCEIVQHFEDGHNPDPCRELKLKANDMKREPLKELHILWCRFSADSCHMNHIVPLIGSSQLPGWSQGFDMAHVKRENTQA